MGTQLLFTCGQGTQLPVADTSCPLQANRKVCLCVHPSFSSNPIEDFYDHPVTLAGYPMFAQHVLSSL